MVADRVDQHVVDETVQLHLDLPALFIVGVDALGHTGGPQAFFDDFFLNELKPFAGLSEESAGLVDQQHGGLTGLEERLHPIESVTTDSFAGDGFVDADEFWRHIEVVLRGPVQTFANLVEG